MSPAHEALASRVKAFWTYVQRQWLNNPVRDRRSWNFVDNPDLRTSNATESTHWRLTARVS